MTMGVIHSTVVDARALSRQGLLVDLLGVGWGSGDGRRASAVAPTLARKGGANLQEDDLCVASDWCAVWADPGGSFPMEFPLFPVGSPAQRCVVGGGDIVQCSAFGEPAFTLSHCSS